MLRRSVRGTLGAAALALGLAVAAAPMAPAPAHAQGQPPAPAQAQPRESRFAAQLPAGRTLLYLEVPSWQETSARLAETDVGRALGTLGPFINRLRAGLDAHIAEQKRRMEAQEELSVIGRALADWWRTEKEIEQELGVSVDALLALLRGGFAAALVDTAPAGGKPQPVPVFLFAGAGARATIESVVAAIKEREGERAPPLYIVERAGLVAVTLDQNALLAPAAPGSAPAQPFFADPRFAALWRQVGPGVFLLHANLAGLLDCFSGSISPDTRAVLQKLGAFDVKALGVGLGFDGPHLREVISLSAPGERRGLLRLLASGEAQPIDPFAAAAGVPADVISFSAGRLDLLKLLDEFVALANAIDPAKGQELAELLAEVDRELGLRLREDVLGALGDLITVESRVPERGFVPETIFSIALRDSAKFPQVLAHPMGKVGLEVRQMQRGGRTFFYAKAPLGAVLGEELEDAFSDTTMTVQSVILGLAGAWTFEGGRVWFSSHPQALVARFEAAGTGSLASQPLYREAMAQLPPGTTQISWGPSTLWVGPVYDIFGYLARAFEVPLRRLGFDVDTALLPRPADLARAFGWTRQVVAVDPEGVLISSQGGFPVATPVLAGIGGAVAWAVRVRAGAESANFEIQAQFLLYQIAAAQEQWKMQKGAYTQNLGDLIGAGYLDESQIARVAGKYSLSLRAEGGGFQARLLPHQPGLRGFEVDQSGVVRPAGAGGPAPRGPAGGGGEEEEEEEEDEEDED